MPEPPTAPRLPLVSLLFLLPVPSLATACGLWWFPDTVLGASLFAAGKVWILLVPLLWYLGLDRGRPSWSAPRHGGWAVAISSGLFVAGSIVGAYALLGPVLIDSSAMRATLTQAGLADPRRYLFLAIYWCTVNSILEEYVWRWFVTRQAAARMPRGAAIVVSALGFTVHHLVAMKAYLPWSATLLAGLGVLIGGLLWSWMYLRYRSVWPGYVSHVFADLAIFGIGARILFG